MNINDQLKIAELYEEGFWDRIKASASGIKSGVKGLVTGQGYAKSNNAAKLNSLMYNKMNDIMKEIEKFESDVSKYSNDPNSQPLYRQVFEIKKIINSFI